MKVDPLRSIRPRPIALVYPKHRSLYVETEHGGQWFKGSRDVRHALSKLTNYVVYVESGLERLKNTTGAREWVLTTWQNKPVKMTHVPTGTTVTSLRGALNTSESPYEDLARVISWLDNYGVTPGPISQMAWKLFRASLSKPLTIGFDPEISRPSFFGGRQEITTPKVYENMVSYDIKAAYPYAMASRDIALTLRKVSNTTKIDPTQSGIARAVVNVPSDLPYPPLPIRLNDNMIQYQWGEIEGTWTWHELAAAKSLGCDINVIDCYAPARTYDLFGSWWEFAQEGRQLPGVASNLAKAIINSTWGQFAMKGEGKSEVAWADDNGDEPFTTDIKNRPMPHTWTVHVASEITSRVRVQMLTEGIYGMSRPPVHVDTDGVIVESNVVPLRNRGESFGQWRIKESMKVMELRAPQLYRFKNGEDNSWQYVAAGLPYEAAVDLFNRDDSSSRVAYLSSGDVQLPSLSNDEDAFVEMLVDYARTLGVA